MAYLSSEVKTEIINNGIKLDDIIKYYKELSQNVVTVGVHKEKGSELVKRVVHTEFGTTLFPLGWYTPFGKVSIVPPRPVIRMYLYRDMMDRISTEYQLAINRQKDTKLKNPSDSANKTLKNLGQECVFMQREKMATGGFDQSTNTTGLNPEENGDRTIAYKGFDYPWFQTGETSEAIDYKVEKASN